MKPFSIVIGALGLVVSLAIIPARAQNSDSDRPRLVHAAVEGRGSQARHAEALLARLREQHKLPALAAVVVRNETTLDLAVTGVRQQGKPELVALDDRFHLGSMGKAITATVIARLVEEGRLAWTTRPVDVFPELAGSIDPRYREVTLELLLPHQGGTPPFGSPGAMKGATSRAGSGSPRDQRRAFSVWLLQAFSKGVAMLTALTSCVLAAMAGGAAPGTAALSIGVLKQGERHSYHLGTLNKSTRQPPDDARA